MSADTKNIVIAIDGYSSCGKSTLARDLSAHYGFIHIESGAMYRCVALYFVDRKIEIQPNNISRELGGIKINFVLEKNKGHILLNEEHVGDKIRAPEITYWASHVAQYPAVRAYLVKQQQALGRRYNVVMEGRDIGSNVFPDAQIKFFLKAELSIRAQRRYAEMKAKNLDVDLQQVKKDLEQRDKRDMEREISPLIMTPDAFLIDNSELCAEKQLKVAVAYCDKKM